MDKNSRDQLQLSPDEMREMGYRVIDMLIEHSYELQNKSVGKKSSPQALEKSMNSELPIQGENPETVLQEVMDVVLANIIHLDHPRQFAWVPSPNNFVSVMADLLSSGYNVFSGLWIAGSGPAHIELTTINWLINLMGMPTQSGGLFVSGGSVANLTGLTVARQVKLNNNTEKALVYSSDQMHSSNERALKVLNFKAEQLIKVPTDEKYCIDVPKLIQQIEADILNGYKPFCIIANAGTTNTGAVDPLLALSKVCKRYSLWFHIDGAYGAAASLSARGKKLLSGIELADSLTIDPHKWLFQPYEIGCLIVKEKHWLAQTFESKASYLRDAQLNEQIEHNFSSNGIQLTRSFRALKLWMSLKVFGIENFSKAISYSFDLAEYAEKKIKELPNWQIITSPYLSILTFRFAPQNYSLENVNSLNEKIVELMIDDGFAMLSSTKLKEKSVLRMCLINPRTTEDDILCTINKLNEIAIQLFEHEPIISKN